MNLTDGITTDVTKAPNFDGVSVKATLIVNVIVRETLADADTEVQAAALIGECDLRARESVLQLAGLRAAVYFGADILPFVQLGQGVKRGDMFGQVSAIVSHPNEEYIRITWQSDLGNENVDPDALADDLRAGVMVLA